MTTPLPRPIPPPAGAPFQASDAELAARAAAGDRGAFELIMRRHNRRLFRLARSLVRSDEEAEDVLQEAYIRAFARRSDLASGGALAAWLARIVANEALGRLRAGARVVSIEEFRTRVATDEEDAPDVDPASDEPDPERLAASGELRRLLEAAVDALPEEFRTVFVLREVEGLSTAETAASLAIRPETVKTRLHRARRLLQERLSERLLPLSPSLFEFQGRRCDRIVGRVLAQLPTPSGGLTVTLTPAEQARPKGRWLARLSAFLARRRKR
jgi:RNA polymerase sigma-70 factor, ECF subfamily